MRRSCLVLVATLSACSFRPGTLAEDAAVDVDVDAEVDATPSDTDGDGVPDASDNCPAAANTDQHDEDGDLRGDACDRCPHLSSATDPDGDGDGVGDDCDPRPATGGDSVLLFESFKDATGYATWTGVGSWMVAGDRLTQSDNTIDLTYTFPPINPTRAAVTAGVHVESLGTPSMTVTPGVLVATGSQGTTQGYLCSVSSRGTPRVDVIGFWPGGNGANNPTWSGTFAAGPGVRLKGTWPET